MKTSNKRTAPFTKFIVLRIVSLLLIVIFLGSCQSNQTLSDQEKANVKAKAEALYSNFFRYCSESKFDSAALVFSDDVYCMGDGELWSKPRIKEAFEGYSKTLKQMVLKMDSLHTRVIAENAVQITSYYTMLQTDTANRETFVKGVQTVLINPDLSEGFISECIESNDYFAIQYTDQVPKEFQTGYTNLNWRHGWEIRQIYPAWLYLIDFMKKKGISPAKAGEDFGKIVSSTWDPKDGFEGFSKSMIFISQSMYSKSKVLQRDSNTLKIEYSKDYKGLLSHFNVNEEDLLASWNSCFVQIADRMGANMTMEDTGKRFVLTFIRK